MDNGLALIQKKNDHYDHTHPRFLLHLHPEMSDIA